MTRLAYALIFVLAGWAGAVASDAEDLVAEGQKAVAAGDLVAAMTAFSQVLDADPYHAAAAFERGKLLVQIYEPRKAIADLTVAVIGEPQNGLAFAWRAEAKMMLNNARGAVEDYDFAVVAAPMEMDVWIMRATFRLKIMDVAGARNDLEAARKLASGETAAKIQTMLDRLN
jgi:tetratricopeptide (TPR) repeat protein